jgi:hypothetical protein
VTQRRHLRPLNRKRRNSVITGSNYRTASIGSGIPQTKVKKFKAKIQHFTTASHYQ